MSRWAGLSARTFPVSRMTTRAVLLVNLGSPDSPSVPDVRRYLREFLMDGRVLDTPWPVRFGVVHFAILPKRPAESAHAYSKIWTTDGSPLVVISRNVQRLLQQRLSIPVALAMRYQNPSIDDAVKKLAAQGVTDTFMIPLFPHYAMSSFETAVMRVQESASRLAPGMTVHVQQPYYDDPAYIDALVASAREHLDRGYDHLLFSFHGIPERHLRKADPTGAHCLASANCCQTPSEAHRFCYRAQCLTTMREFVAKAGVPANKYSFSFQSRLGKDPWLKPYTDFELERFAREGIRKILVMCPAFVSDCLETIEEIGMRGRDSFAHAGGEELQLIPCMNEHPRWIAALESFVTRRWPDSGTVGHVGVA
jgi:protoporphyrin/coproporphyrin ferrochelatase